MPLLHLKSWLEIIDGGGGVVLTTDSSGKAGSVARLLFANTDV